MPSLATKPYRLYEVFLFTVLLCFAAPGQAQEKVVVAVVLDGPSARLANQQQLYVDELLVLTSIEFDVEIRNFVGEWTKASTLSTIDAAYADPDVDLVLIIGFVANQLAATRSEFPKPTFLPVILDTGLLKSGAKDGTSGVRNLNYLSAYANFSDDLDTLSRFTPYRSLVLFVDENLSHAIPQLRDAALEVSTARGIDLIEVTHDGLDHRLMNRVPAAKRFSWRRCRGCRTRSLPILLLPLMRRACLASVLLASLTLSADCLPLTGNQGTSIARRDSMRSICRPSCWAGAPRISRLHRQRRTN